ncbi:zf-HC2 domain-containing protein [Cellulomonas sp.]|uniref:anti-sigma factor family protein n=1 Tax=Cellulomonas sp. TaxID=40001 RepID=UPI001B2437D5|nr:zf-HC2 domain-containing protein [Cellulomonas sp.]MBO9555005.1 zf-HC2 domain-containing protein [Cellulomonas sp.]
MSGREPVPGGRTDDPYRDWDAAYVLGALSASDRRAFEEHLGTCDACRTAVGELAGIPALLRTVPADEVPDVAPAEDDAAVVELRSVAHAVHARRRRRRVVLVGAAAALVVAGGTAGALVDRAVSRPEPAVAAGVTRLDLEPVGTADVTADLTLEAKGWGTRIDWSCTYPAGASGRGYGDDVGGDGPVYELVLVDEDGTSTVVATWVAHSTQARGLGASSSIAKADIAEVQIRVSGADAPVASATT